MTLLKRSNFKAILFSAVFVLFSPWASAQVFLPGKVTLVDLSEETLKKFAVLRIEGNIVPPLAEEFKAAISQFPAGRRVIMDFHSPGGMHTEGVKIIEAIKEARKSISIDSFVDNGALCASMCIPLFMQGEKRVAGARSSFMFHGAAPWYTNTPTPSVTKEYTQSLLDAGVSGEWLQKLWDLGVFSEPMEYWASGEDLFNENSGVVTSLKPKVIKHEPWSAPIDPQIGPH